MDVLYFLKLRTRFISQYYELASESFVEVKRKIEAEEAPYIPPYSEDPEPPFLEEWLEADTSLEILGVTCVSMLSEALKLYFLTWEKNLRIKCHPKFKKEFRIHGFVHGYKLCFGLALKTNWNDCPADFTIIEQIVLARNSSQHPSEITDLTIAHSAKTREKYPKPFFISESERGMLEKDNFDSAPWMVPMLSISGESLIEAVHQVELLCEWLEEKIHQ